MTGSSKSLGEVLVAAVELAFPGYLTQKISMLDVEVTGQLDGAISAATAGLTTSLEELLALPTSQQKQSPLELVRAATLPITSLLDDAAVPHPMRDAHDVEIHPEDLYDLYPATSRDLGEEAWRAHTQWGIDKARLVAGLVPVADAAVPRMPTVALFGLSAERRALVASALEDRGYAHLIWRNPSALADGICREPILAFVDLGHPNAHDAVRQLVAAHLRVVAVGDRVDDFATAGLMALGADDVVELDRIVNRLDDLLPRIV